MAKNGDPDKKTSGNPTNHESEKMPKVKNSPSQAYAHLQSWNRAMIGLISWLESVNKEATNLLIFIQKEYQQ